MSISVCQPEPLCCAASLSLFHSHTHTHFHLLYAPSLSPSLALTHTFMHSLSSVAYSLPLTSAARLISPLRSPSPLCTSSVYWLFTHLPVALSGFFFKSHPSLSLTLSLAHYFSHSINQAQAYLSHDLIPSPLFFPVSHVHRMDSGHLTIPPCDFHAKRSSSK